jgi:hypothetical protein
MELNPFYTFPTPKTKRFEEKENHHEYEGRNLFDPAWEELVPIAACKVLQHPYGYSAHDGPGNRVQSAENYNWENQKAETAD